MKRSRPKKARGKSDNLARASAGPAGRALKLEAENRALRRELAARTRAEEERSEAQGRLERIVAVTPGIVCSFRMRPDGSACFAYGGERIAEHYGVAPGILEKDAAPFFALVHPDDLGGLREAIAESARRLSPVCHEWRMRNPVRGEMWIEAKSIPLREPDGSTMWHGVASDITARRQVEEVLRAQHVELENLYATTPVGLALIDRKLRFLRINERLAAINGKPVEAHLGRTIQEALPELAPVLVPIYRRVLEGGGPVLDVEINGSTPAEPGVLRHWLASYFPLRAADGSVAGISIAVTDITDRKRSEAELRRSEERFSRAFHVGPAGMTITRVSDGRFLSVNESFLRMFELSREEAIGHTSTELNMLSPGERAKLIQRQLESGGLHNAELVARTKSGRTINLLFSSKPMAVDGVDCLMTTLIDITDRKQAESALQETQRRLTSLIENLPGTVYRCRNDRNWTTEFVSESVFQLSGYPAADFMEHRRELGQLIHPQDQRRVWEEAQTALRERRRYEVRYRIITASGAEKWVWEQGAGVFDAGGTLQALEGFVLDITERKHAEEALHESEERLRLAVIGGGVGLWEWEVATGNLTWNDQLKAIFGLSASATGLTLDRFIAAIHPEDKARTEQAFRAALADHAEFNMEYRILRPDGTVRWIVAAGRGAYDSTGRPVRMRGAALDITARKHAEEALQEKSALLSNVINSSTDFIFVKDRDLRTVLCNEVFARALGKRPEEVYGKTDVENGWPPEQVHGNPAKGIRGFEADDREALAGKTVHNPLDPADVGQEIHFFDTMKIPLRDPSGTVIGVLGVARDITARKKAEDALREHEHLLSESQRIASIGSWKVELSGIHVWTAETYRILGISPESRPITTESFLERIHPEDRKIMLDWIGHCSAGEKPGALEFRIVRPDGALRFLQGEGDLIRRPDGTPAYLTGTVQDITERKRAEQAVRESETKLQAIVGSSRDAIGVSRKGVHVFVNPSYVSMFGYRSAEDLIGTPILALIAPESREKILRHVEERAAGKVVPSEYEAVALRRDGTQFDMEVRASTYTLKGEQYTQVILRDVTERKRAEAALRELSLQVIRTEDAERRRIARELHDSTGQKLAALGMTVGMLHDAPGSTDSGMVAKLADCLKIIEECSQEIRTLSYLLHPPLLDELGLAAAIGNYVEGFSMRSGVQVSLDVPRGLDRLPAEIELALFRVMQECLGNVHRHAGVSSAQVRLSGDSGHVTLEVTDRGLGISTSSLRALQEGGGTAGVGIAGMRERLRLVGGRLEIVSEGHGTTIRAVVPRCREAE